MEPLPGSTNVRQPARNGEMDLRQLLGALKAVKRGDFGVRLPLEQTGASPEKLRKRSTTLPSSRRSTHELDRTAEQWKEGKIHAGAPRPWCGGGGPPQ